MTEPELTDELAKSLAEYDGCLIVEEHSMMVGGWEPRMEPSAPKPKSREEYEREARRFLHCFGVAVNLLREHRGFV